MKYHIVILPSNYLLNFRKYCTALTDQNYTLDEIKECLDLKEFKQFSVTTENIGIEYGDNKKLYETERNLQFLLRSTSNKSNIFEEVLIIDFIGLVGSIGGSLGLFVGFSFFGYVTPILDAVFDRVASYFLLIN